MLDSPPSRAPRSAIIGACVLLAACFSGSLLQDPKPVPPGKVRVALGFEVGPDTVTPAVSARVGVAPRLEVRGKGAMSGGEVGLNVQAVEDEQVDVMLMPHAFYYDVDNAFEEHVGTQVVGFGMPAVVSFDLQTERVPTQLFVGPDVRAGRRDMYRGSFGFGALGVHAGMSMSGRRDFGTVTPECAWFIGAIGPRASQHDYGDEQFFARGEHTWTCSVSVGFGHARDRAMAPEQARSLP